LDEEQVTRAFERFKAHADTGQRVALAELFAEVSAA
jgi:hypothetical protein